MTRDEAMREEAQRLARHLGVLTRWAEAQKDPRPRLFTEVDVDGAERRAMSHDEMAALAARHRTEVGAILKRAAMGAFAPEIAALTSRLDLARSLWSIYSLGADRSDPSKRSP